MKTDYLEKYSCSADGKITMLRDYVDEMKNCEDILMNFVISDEADSGPVLVEAKRLRDHGDARNEENGEMEMRNVGLSSRRREHRKRRVSSKQTNLELYDAMLSKAIKAHDS
ncbi:hypothetical protein C5167_015738 [Papaver somniferum]|uniref:Glycosyl transferase 64 domain-containing protein n=1 Tax=Papaver somniferum TaxID=3469 RepID=A0A4Y7J6Y1_PAPSO|nr:hypothetical protein C5167_015738 [Papaver somniferum]